MHTTGYLRSIKYLYAAGEVRGGVHGACRLSTLAITDCLVFGRIASHNVTREQFRLGNQQSGSY